MKNYSKTRKEYGKAKPRKEATPYDLLRIFVISMGDWVILYIVVNVMVNCINIPINIYQNISQLCSVNVVNA
jgi:hypothetical protein